MALICRRCIHDEDLRNILEHKAIMAKCNYCGKKGLAIEMNDIAEVIDPYLRKYCCLGEEVPRFDGDDDNVEYVREGDDLIYFLQEELGMDQDPVDDLIKILQSIDPADPRDGGEEFYDKWEPYQRNYVSSREYHENWKEFADGIKHGRRFFDEVAKIRLERILGKPGSQVALELPFIELGRGKQVQAVYRARRADSESEAEKFLKNPRKELRPPESDKAISGRMNPAGIAVFYGALTEETAIVEVRPFVGSLVVVGRFNLKRKLRLLNLAMIGSGYTGSIFNPEYENRAARLHFLQSFHALIVKPVQPCEELLEYLPTQAVAEYVSNILGFDGILYASAQAGYVKDAEGGVHWELKENKMKLYNIVLFGKALDTFSFARSSAKVMKITSIKYDFSTQPLLGRDLEE